MLSHTRTVEYQNENCFVDGSHWEIFSNVWGAPWCLICLGKKMKENYPYFLT